MNDMNPSSHTAHSAAEVEQQGSAIVFATNNSHKLDEIRAILGDRFKVLSLRDIDCHVDIPETANTLEGNAIQKARYIAEHYGYDCFADDTGLEVTALGGEPGVHSARYADGTDHDSEANMQKLLARLQDKDDRRAQFRTVICLANVSLGKGLIMVDLVIISSCLAIDTFGEFPQRCQMVVFGLCTMVIECTMIDYVMNV